MGSWCAECSQLQGLMLSQLKRKKVKTVQASVVETGLLAANDTVRKVFYFIWQLVLSLQYQTICVAINFSFKSKR